MSEPAPKPEPTRPATYEDLIAVPDHKVAEILDGVLEVSPRPGPKHAKSATEIGADLVFPYGRGRGGPGGWEILIEPELHLGPDVLVPDLAGWRRETLPDLPVTAYFAVRPDWVCEVLSPATSRIDRLKKMRIYAREGVGHAWLVDPISRLLEVYRLHEGSWLQVGVHGDDEIVRAEPFDAIELDLLPWWGEVREAAEPPAE